MKVALEWAIPLVLGLVVGAGLWALDGDEPAPPPSPTGSASTTVGPDATPVLSSPFPESRGAEGVETSFLLLAPQGRTAAQASLNETGLNWTQRDLDWAGDRLAFFTPQNVLQGCRTVDGNFTCSDPWWAFLPWPLPKAIAYPDDELGPRLGMSGYNATRATIYVFDARGLLAATNDAKENWTRFPGSPTTMDSALWYLGGNGTAPNGTEKPPSFATPLIQKLRPLIEGLPVGGVASTQSNAYVSLYGTLFITARIDELAYAP